MTQTPTIIPIASVPLVFCRELPKHYSIFPQSQKVIPIEFVPSVFYRELQKNYSIFPQSQKAIPIESVPSVFYRELQNNYNPCHNHRRVSRWNHQRTVQIPMCATIRLPSRLAHLPKESPIKVANPMHVCFDTYLPTNVSTIFKISGGIFKILVWSSKNTDGI